MPTASPEEGTVAPVVLEDDVPVIDLDADMEEGDAVERLIAEALAKEPRQADAREVGEPVIDLDAEEEEEAAARSSPPPGFAAAEAPPLVEPPTLEASAGHELATETDAARPLIDLGPVSSPEVRDRLLAEALAHAEHQDARYRVPFSGGAAVGRWKALAGIVILLVAGLVALAPPEWARPERPAQLAPADRARNLRMALLFQAQQIEAFRVRAQRLPTTLDEVTETLPGVRYVRSGSRAYQLIAYEADGNAIVYDSTDPAPAFAELATSWARSGSQR